MGRGLFCSRRHMEKQCGLIIIWSVISGTLTLAPLKNRYGSILVEEDPRQAISGPTMRL
jgi:hypothetical protein